MFNYQSGKSCRTNKWVVIFMVGYALFVHFINPHLPWEPDPSLNPDPNHIHADFAIWIEGEQIDFSDAKYMSGVSYDDSSHDEEDEHHHEYLHLHDEVGHVIHMHKADQTLQEFLDSIGLTFTQTCLMTDAGERYCNQKGAASWRMFVNAEEVEVDPSYVFADLESILLTFGADETQLRQQFKAMTDDACLYSKACPWRGDPPAENCIADPEVPCTVPEDQL